MQTLRLAEVKAAALKAYNEGRLLAQNAKVTEGAYGYEIVCNGTPYVCAIGAALNREALDQIEGEAFQQKSLRAVVDKLPDYIACTHDEGAVLSQIQNAHDVWSTMAESRTINVADEYEAKFLAMLQPE